MAIKVKFLLTLRWPKWNCSGFAVVFFWEFLLNKICGTTTKTPQVFWKIMGFESVKGFSHQIRSSTNLRLRVISWNYANSSKKNQGMPSWQMFSLGFPRLKMFHVILVTGILGGCVDPSFVCFFKCGLRRKQLPRWTFWDVFFLHAIDFRILFCFKSWMFICFCCPENVAIFWSHFGTPEVILISVSHKPPPEWRLATAYQHLLDKQNTI